MWFFGAKKILGLDIGTSSIKIAELSSGRRGLSLSKFAMLPLNPGAVSGGEILEAQVIGQGIASLVSSIKSKSKNVSTGMWGTSVIVKKISMPRMDEKLVSEQIRWEAEQYIPFDVNEISLEHYILKKTASTIESMDVLLVAAKQEYVFRYLELVESANLQCSILDVSGFALANCFEYNYGIQPGIVALLNIGAGVANLVVLNEGELIFSRDIAVGGFNYTQDIHKSMGVSLQEAEALKISASVGQEVPDEVNAIIASTNDSVVDEIRNSFEFFAATSGGLAINRFYVSGGCIFIPKLVEALARATGLTYEVMDPFARISYDTKAFSADYIAQIKSISSVVLGLAMRKENDR